MADHTTSDAGSESSSSQTSSNKLESEEESLSGSSPASSLESVSPTEIAEVAQIRRRPYGRHRAISRRHRHSTWIEKSNNALSVSGRATSVSLWKIREQQFETFRASILVLPVPDTVVRVDRAKGYSLHVMSVLNWVLPTSFVRSSVLRSTGRNRNGSDDEDEEEEILITLSVHVSLFHSVSKRFFGNTWVSPEIPVDHFQIKQGRDTKANTIRYVIESVLLNFRAYFLTDVVDSNCVGIMELVVNEKDPDSKATIKVAGCGWTILPLFASNDAPQQGQSGNVSLPAFSKSGQSVNVFTGSPRVLWEIPSTAWHQQQMHEQCKLYYQLVRYDPMLAISMFLRKNELVGALEPIPGLKNANLANIDMGTNPKMLLCEDQETTYEEALITYVKMASIVPKSIQVEEAFTLNVIASHVSIHLREEVEADLISRLKISRKTIHSGATSIEGEVSARVLKLALHNGRCFRTRQYIVPLKVSNQGGGDALFCIKNLTKLNGVVLHPHFAVVVVLQYTVHFRLAWPSKVKQQAMEAKKPLPPEEDVVLVTMGARTLVPSDGKKLYFYDKHHLATASSVEPLMMSGVADVGSNDRKDPSVERQRVLHVELLSGTHCRPYSDNVLYTPRNRENDLRLLRENRIWAKDSFAFVDLQLKVEGAVSPSNQALENGILDEEAWTPVSPTKKAVADRKGVSMDNQVPGSVDGVQVESALAAEHWAKKMLSKANKNSLLAQTLNALATSRPQGNQENINFIDSDPQSSAYRSPTSPARPSSPVNKKQNASRPTDLVPVLNLPTTSELSRASKTLLSRYGYMDAHDSDAVQHVLPSSPSSLRSNQLSHDQKPGKAVPQSIKSLSVELNDIYKANEIRFHFGAYRTFNIPAHPNSIASNPPSRIYFTFQFYNFPPTRTETLRLSKAFDHGTNGEIQTYLLMRESPANKPSLAIQFDVDTTITRDPLGTRQFAEYLLKKQLYVDVWDADSLFQIGTFVIPLHELLRQGASIKKFQAEVDIVEPIDMNQARTEMTEDTALAGITDVDSVTFGSHKALVGKIQLLTSNYGLKGQHYIPNSRPTSTSDRQSLPEQSSGKVDLLLPKESKHRVRARPLVESNPELYRLLSQEGFYGNRGSSKQQAQRQLQARESSDATSLTPQEISILCNLFRSDKSGATPHSSVSTSFRRTRIECDFEAKTGLFALLSLKPPVSSQQPATSLPPSMNPLSSQQSSSQRNNQLLNATIHGDRLKRILTIAQKNEVSIADAFAQFDVNKDNLLSRDEFLQAMRSLGAVFADLTDDDILALADAMDKDHDGNINYKEFGAFLATNSDQVLTAAMKKQQWSSQIMRIIERAMEKGVRVHHVFAQFDASGDGQISRGEFSRALKQLGVPTKDLEGEILSLLMADLDKNNDGNISYEEFLQYLGISIETNKREVIQATVQEMQSQIYETLKRLDTTHGINLDEMFCHFDQDKNGKLSMDEFSQALSQLLQIDQEKRTINTDHSNTLKTIKKEAIDAFVKQINANGDDVIDYREFLILCGISAPNALQKGTEKFRQAARSQAEKKLIKLLIRAFGNGVTAKEIFQHFDANADGKITVPEFQKALEQLFHIQNLTTDDFSAITARFDENGDGEISLAEFQRFGVAIQEKLHVVIALFLPHIDKVKTINSTSKLSRNDWQKRCVREFKFSRQQVDMLTPVLVDLDVVDEKTGSVDVQLLQTLLSGSNSAQSEPTQSNTQTQRDAIARLHALLNKAKAQGVDVRNSFAHFDIDGNGVITKTEFREALLSLGCFDDVDKKTLDGMLEYINTDGNDNISFHEFRAFLSGGGSGDDKNVDQASPANEKINKDTVVQKLKSLLEKALEKGVDVDKCFSHFDKDSDGKITRTEFITAMSELGFNAEESMLNEVMEMLDRDGSGEVSLSEFKQLFLTDQPLVSAKTPADTKQTVKPPQTKPKEADSQPTESTDASTETSALRQTESLAVGDRLRDLLLKAEANGVDVKMCFSHFDTDGSGKITRDEFVNGLNQLPGFEGVDEQEISALVAMIDSDSSGSVSMKEFDAFLRKKSATSSITSKDNHDSSKPLPSTVKRVEQESPSDKANDSDFAQPTEPSQTDAINPNTTVSEDPSANSGQVNTEGVVEATASAETEVKAAESKKKTVTKPPLRSSSFAVSKGKALNDLAARRAKTDSEAVAEAAGEAIAKVSDGSTSQAEEGATNKKPPASRAPLQRSSFAAARAAKAATAKNKPLISTVSVSSTVSEGLEKLRNLLLTALASGVNVQQSFDHFDKDKNGRLTYEEFTSGLQELGQDFQKLTQDEIMVMAKELDYEQKGEISVEGLMKFINTDSRQLATKHTAEVPPVEKGVEVVKDTTKKLPVRRTPSIKPTTPATSSSTPPVSATSDVSPSEAMKPHEMKTPKPTEKSPRVEPTDIAPQTQTEDKPGVQAGLEYECGYVFSKDPEIRAVELKLRKAALDAYSRGILPLRIVSKFLEDGSSNPLNPIDMKRQGKKRKKDLLRVEFLQVLMELGFSLLSDKSNDDDGMSDYMEGGMPHRATRMNDHLYARQLERLARYKHHIKEETKAQKQLVHAVTKSKHHQQQAMRRFQQQRHGGSTAEENLRRYVEEKNQLLRVLSYYRDGHKKSLVYSLLREQVTTTIMLFPSFGGLLFLELPFQNPYNHHERFRLDIVLPSISELRLVLDVEIVRNSDEWAFYRENLPLSYGGDLFGSSPGDTPAIEKEMIDEENEVVMEAHDRLRVPVRVRWLDARSKLNKMLHNHTVTTTKPTATVPILIKSCTHGHTVALVKLELHPQPFVCHRVLRFSHPSGSIWRWRLRCPRGKYVVCIDPRVAVDYMNEDTASDDNKDGAMADSACVISLKCRVGEYPSLEEFYLVLYDDKYYAVVHEIWQIRIQSKLRLDLHATLGQSVKNELVIKGDSGVASSSRGGRRRHVRCFTTFQHAHHLQFRPSHVFQLVPNAYNRIEFAFCAVDIPPSTPCRVLVNLVDVDTQELVGAWSIYVTLALPLITKTYDLRLPLHQAAQKKIAYANPWDQLQTIILRSSESAKIKPRDAVLQIPGNGQVFLRLGFAAMNQRTQESIYLFINDKQTDQIEECLLFHVTYG